MDSITHSLFAVMLFHACVPEGLILFAVLGAVLPDSDILLKRLSDHDPGLYVFSHGGFTHSIAGTVTVSTGIMLGFLVCLLAGGMRIIDGSYIALAFGLSWAGALSHIMLDALAFPGIPLLYPATSRKFSAGVFPGPSLVLLAASLGFLLMYMSGSASVPALTLYAAFGCVYILAHGVIKWFMATHHGGITIPSFNPFNWLVIREADDSFQVYRTGLSSRHSGVKVFPKNNGIDPGFIDRHKENPELQRLAYYSYIMVAEKEGSSVVIRDPLREEGVLYYPPSHTRIRLEQDGPAGV